jgi:Rod binding domain-containing protein
VTTPIQGLPIAAGPAPLSTAPAKPAGATHEQKRAKELATAAREFEQIFVRSMLKGTPIAGKGDVYGDMAVDAMAKHVTEGKGLGLGDLIRRSIEKSESASKPETHLKVSK